MSAGNYFYSYIIPATINHNNVYKLQMIKHMNRQFVVLHKCTKTLFHTRYNTEIHKTYLDAPITTKDNTLTLSDKKCALQT